MPATRSEPHDAADPAVLQLVVSDTAALADAPRRGAAFGRRRGDEGSGCTASIARDLTGRLAVDREVHDRVIQRLFPAALSIAKLRAPPADAAITERDAFVVGELDATIGELYLLSLEASQATRAQSLQ